MKDGMKRSQLAGIGSISWFLAESEGFEPPEPSRVQRFSRPYYMATEDQSGQAFLWIEETPGGSGVAPRNFSATLARADL